MARGARIALGLLLPVLVAFCGRGAAQRPVADELCVGDCDHSGAVTVDEVVIGVNIALGTLAVDACTALDADANGQVSVDELVTAVNRILDGCPVTGTPTPIAT